MDPEIIVIDSSDSEDKDPPPIAKSKRKPELPPASSSPANKKPRCNETSVENGLDTTRDSEPVDVIQKNVERSSSPPPSPSSTKPKIRHTRRINPTAVEAPTESRESSSEPGPSSSKPPRKETMNGHTRNKFSSKELTQEKKEKVERVLMKICKQIDEYDSKEVDWDSDVEENSSYLLKDRCVNTLMREYQRILSHYGYNSVLTGRPLQKKFIVERVTRYPEIDKAVEKFLNSFCTPRPKKGRVTYAAPEFPDILDEVSSAIDKHQLTVIPSEVQKIAEDLFKYTLKIYKKRRGSELKIAIPALVSQDLVDPAENDAALRQKLQENVKMRRKEEDVLLEFVKKQENKSMKNEDELDEDEDEYEDEDDGEEAEAEPEVACEVNDILLSDTDSSDTEEYFPQGNNSETQI